MHEPQSISNIKNETVNWIARLNNGDLVRENDGASWSSISPLVVWAGFEKNKQLIVSLPKNKNKYIQGKTGSCPLTGGEVAIESRWIGFEKKDGSCIKIRVREIDGLIELET